MKLKEMMLAPALIAVAMMAGCGEKQESQERASAAASSTQSAPTQQSSEAPSTNGSTAPSQAIAQQSAPPSPSTPEADGLVRVHFDELFNVDSNGGLTPKVPIDVNGTQMTPGVTFGGGVQFGGFAFGQAVGHDFGVRRLQNGFAQLVKVYN
ncbi:hypothetical protein FEP54_06044 [Burkholderia multivorans]|uniref:hypothetical protein n=1 Tax=Burkholderia multivorans TaxID=87883 RepID=UPI0028623CCF|nr:hypothetical protein [Burkholderia multivorans]MDR8927286.1 hypothetical protein [Burkholderia multivorans]MDR8969559.1 hypothetical protein [Burkholderia multivorans]MDR8993856.1 hypothetical protein [Burkholderia multivorans]MDR9024648.1 hypothetical protein [Burkholderia multivorans]MDR9030582.1 hypothetical protein [Burkholderia multivorans]